MVEYKERFYKPKNVIGSVIATGTDFVHGTDTSLELADGQKFPPANWVRIDDGVEYAIYEYEVRNTNTLSSMSLAPTEDAESTGSYTFPEGTEVTLELSAETIRELIRVLTGEQKIPNWLSFAELTERPSDAQLDEGLYFYQDHLWFRRRL